MNVSISISLADVGLSAPGAGLVLMSCCEQMVDAGGVPNWEQRAAPGRPVGEPRWQQFTTALKSPQFDWKLPPC